MTGWRLLLTRPAEECAAQAQYLAMDGVHCSSQPLLRIDPVPITEAMRKQAAALDGYALVIVVSKPAARLGMALLGELRAATPRPAWFAVGAGTAQVLNALGQPADFPSGGDDSEALLRLPALLQRLDCPSPRVLILRGEGGREWLAEQLRARGAEVDYLQLYRRALPTYAPTALRQRIGLERLNGVVVSSGQGFDNLLRLAADDTSWLLRLPLFVPSQRVAQIATAAGAIAVINCGGASVQALREGLQQPMALQALADATADKNA